MPLQKTRRYRGVVLTTQGWDKFQAAKVQAEFNEIAGDHFTLEELSERMGLSPNTTAKILGCTEPVDKRSLQWAFRAFGLELNRNDYSRSSAAFEEAEAITSAEQSDWGSTIDTSTCLGRSEELVRLQQWVLEEQCRLVLLLGIGGIGKSTLAAKLVQQIQREIATQMPSQLKTHVLLKAQAKDYVREMQERLIIEPIVEQLLIQFGNPYAIEQQLKAMLKQGEFQTPARITIG